MAVESGHWPLYRFDPRRLAAGEKPLILDSGPPKAPLATFMAGETRFRVVQNTYPDRYAELVKAAEDANRLRFERLRFAAGFEDVAAKDAPSP